MTFTRKLALPFLFFIVSHSLFAHKDIIFQETYGNVKVFLRTGFKYSSFEKIKVIGQLTEELSKALKYKDTIFIEYIQDYTRKYAENIFIPEYETLNHAFPYQIKKHPKNNNIGIAIRIFSKEIDIINTLKLIEYSLINRSILRDKIITKKLTSKWEEEKGYEPVLETLPTTLINKITNQHSELINKIIKRKIYIKEQAHYGIEIYWQNDNFIFEYKNYEKPKEVIFKINNYYYTIGDNFVFTDKNHFYFLDIRNKTTKRLIEIKAGSYWPFQIRGRFNNKIILSNNRNDLNVFLIDKKKVISEFN